MIRPDEIDPTIQTYLKDRMAQITAGQGAALDPAAVQIRTQTYRAWRAAAQRYAAYFWGAGAAWLSAIIAVPVLQSTSEGLAVMTLLSLMGLASWLMVQGFRQTNRELTRHVNPEVMRHAARIVQLGRTEQLYCEAVAGLIDAGHILGEPTQKELLGQLNELLTSHRALDTPLQRYLSGAGGLSAETMEREVGELSRRRDEQEDPLARSTLEQSLTLCTQRLEQARRIEPARAQVAAQQELIQQTMASVQASLARIGAAGAVPVRADVLELQESVTRVSHQARAVEDAVTEVITLGA